MTLLEMSVRLGQQLVRLDCIQQGATMPFNFAKYEQWRWHPMLNNNLQRMLPGLGIGTSAFIVYVIYDKTLGAGSRQQSH